MLSVEATRMQELLQQLEEVAGEVLCDRAEMISLDRRRNTNREAFRALKNTLKQKPVHPTTTTTTNTTTTTTTNTDTSATSTSANTNCPVRRPDTVPIQHHSMYSCNTWMCIGDMFIRMPKTVVMESIEKEQGELDREITSLRTGLRGKVDKLRKLQGDDPSRGSLLNPLSSDEWMAVKQLIR